MIAKPMNVRAAEIAKLGCLARHTKDCVRNDRRPRMPTGSARESSLRRDRPPGVPRFGERRRSGASVACHTEAARAIDVGVAPEAAASVGQQRYRRVLPLLVRSERLVLVLRGAPNQAKADARQRVARPGLGSVQMRGIRQPRRWGAAGHAGEGVASRRGCELTATWGNDDERDGRARRSAGVRDRGE
jgi:hypothetical protein